MGLDQWRYLFSNLVVLVVLRRGDLVLGFALVDERDWMGWREPSLGGLPLKKDWPERKNAFR